MSKNEESKTQIDNKNDTEVTWKDLGLLDSLCQACKDLKWSSPTKIQREAIPLALQGKDVIGLAETGSGKTAAFVLPVLQGLIESPSHHNKGYFALILAPTRELADQISEQFKTLSLGASIQVKCAVIVGGEDMMTQALKLAQKPHIIIATPGRLADHLEKTKGFGLNSLKYLVMDEADRMLNLDFEVDVDKILKKIPRQRRTLLFSATMTEKVRHLRKASLKNFVKVEVSTKYQTVETLEQFLVFTPLKDKDVNLVHLLNEMAGKNIIIFCGMCTTTMRIALMVRSLGFTAVPLHGKMSQKKRLEVLTKFKAMNRSILITTDVAARGLDILHVDVVINYDVPNHSKVYIHRVGRTARVGRSGRSFTLVIQYEVELFQRIEHLISKKLDEYKIEEKAIEQLRERVGEAQRIAKIELKGIEDLRKSGKRKKYEDDDDEDDTEQSYGVRKRMNGKFKGKRGK